MLNTAVMILFFNVAPGTRKEVFYPLMLSGFFMIVLLISEWVKYYSFNHSLQRMSCNLNEDLRPITEEQKAINRIMTTAYEIYTSEVSQIKAKNKNKSYFISQWIHNLKTPISVIDLIAQKCRLEDKDPYEAIENITQENKKLNSSLEQVLTIIRLDDFEKDYEPQCIDLVQSIKKLLNDRKKQFIYSGVFPELKCETDEMLVLTDEKWNMHMLEQIISNAIKYSTEEGKTKKIYIDISHNMDNTLLTIRDEGIGIPSYDMDRIFEPFFTGENGRKYRGTTGIGLYVCSEIAKKLGHEIIAKSKLTMGTEFTIKYITKL